jgi:hypothetical protein
MRFQSLRTHGGRGLAVSKNLQVALERSAQARNDERSKPVMAIKQRLTLPLDRELILALRPEARNALCLVVDVCGWPSLVAIPPTKRKAGDEFRPNVELGAGMARAYRVATRRHHEEGINSKTTPLPEFPPTAAVP